MLTRILDGRSPWVPLLDEFGPQVSVVGPYASMLEDLVRTFGA